MELSRQSVSPQPFLRRLLSASTSNAFDQSVSRRRHDRSRGMKSPQYAYGIRVFGLLELGKQHNTIPADHHACGHAHRQTTVTLGGAQLERGEEDPHLTSIVVGDSCQNIPLS